VSAVSSLSRQDEPEVRRVVKIGAIRHLYCLLQLMSLRPLWIAQDQVRITAPKIPYIPLHVLAPIHGSHRIRCRNYCSENHKREP
jgi:hypothetical protein